MYSLAAEHGYDWEYLWNHAENEALRELRSEPSQLLPGDRVFLPPKRQRQETCATSSTHTIRIKTHMVMVKLVLFDNGLPRATQPYQFEVGEEWRDGQTDDAGVLEEWVPPTLKRARLRIGEPPEEFDVELGHVDPPDTVSGVQDRLANLGLYEGPNTDDLDEPTLAALLEFQSQHPDLEATGELDAATIDALVAEHGG